MGVGCFYVFGRIDAIEERCRKSSVEEEEEEEAEVVSF